MLQRDGSFVRTAPLCIYNAHHYQASSTSWLCSLLFTPCVTLLPVSKQVRYFNKTTRIVGFIYSFFIIAVSSSSLFDYDFELRSSSFPFGKTRASSVLLSLNHDLFTIHDIEALCRINHSAPLQVVDLTIHHLFFTIR